MIKATLHTQSKLDCTYAIVIDLKTRDIDEMRYWRLVLLWSIRRYQLFKVIIWSTYLIYILSFGNFLILQANQSLFRTIKQFCVRRWCWWNVLLQSLMPYIIIYRPSCALPFFEKLSLTLTDWCNIGIACISHTYR